MSVELDNYPKPSVTVDIVVFTVIDQTLNVLLIKRNLPPFKGSWALPGGFVRENEDLIEAAKRELLEETGAKDVYLEQLYTFGKPNRDPRGRVITVSYLALVNQDEIKLSATTDASEVKWHDISSLPQLAFDHKPILEYAYKRLKWKFEYTSVAFSLLSKEFTISQVQKIYEIVFNKKFDKRNFVKKILSLNILLEKGINREVPHRPPMLYSLKNNIGNIIQILPSGTD